MGKVFESMSKAGISVKLEPKWPSWKFSGGLKLIEIPEKRIVGSEGNFKFGFNPLFGMEMQISILDWLIRFAGALTGGVAVASFIVKVRDLAAKGFGKKDSFAAGKLDIDIFFKVEGEIKGGFGLKYSDGKCETDTEASSVEASMGLSIEGHVIGTGRVWRVEATAAAKVGSGGADPKEPSKIIGTVKPKAGKDPLAATGQLKFTGLALYYLLYYEVGVKSEETSAKEHEDDPETTHKKGYQTRDEKTAKCVILEEWTWPKEGAGGEYTDCSLKRRAILERLVCAALLLLSVPGAADAKATNPKPGERGTMIPARPLLNLRVDIESCQYDLFVNGGLVMRNLAGTPAHEEQPINQFVRSGSNEIEVLIYLDTDAPDACDVKVSLVIKDAEHDQAPGVTALVLAHKAGAADPTAGSTPAGVFDSRRGFEKPADKGDFKVGPAKLRHLPVHRDPLDMRQPHVRHAPPLPRVGLFQGRQDEAGVGVRDQGRAQGRPRADPARVRPARVVSGEARRERFRRRVRGAQPRDRSRVLQGHG